MKLQDRYLKLKHDFYNHYRYQKSHDAQAERNFWKSQGIAGARFLIDKTARGENSDSLLLGFISDLIALAGVDVLPFVHSAIQGSANFDHVTTLLYAVALIAEDNPDFKDDAWVNVLQRCLECSDLEVRERAPYATRILSRDAARSLLKKRLRREPDRFIRQIIEEVLQERLLQVKVIDTAATKRNITKDESTSTTRA